MMIYHALGLHMHQPPGNLKLLLETNEWEAKQIVLCYKRPLKYVKRYRGVAKIHLGFSGILLEQLCSPEIIERFSGVIDLKRMIEEYPKVEGFEFVGMGYYHPLFPLIPMEDWKPQIEKWKKKAKELGFGAEGFWPPEMGFCMEMIPVLCETGFRYVVVDGVHVKPCKGEKRLTEEEIMYKPHIAVHDSSEIVVIPRDRGISNAQESGLDPSWFEREVLHKTKGCMGDCLVTSWSDGENGGWFRQMHEESGFWGHFFAPYMEKVENGDTSIIPIKISEFIAENPPETYVEVRTGAWNVADTSGYDFSQWEGTEKQKEGIEEIWATSREYHRLGRRISEIEEHILRAETSCNLFWGDAWIHRIYEDTRKAKRLMERIKVKE
ncbi:MAG: glycoside hydrolase family 57 [Candidatus Syntropharchaeia archaeon]